MRVRIAAPHNAAMGEDSQIVIPDSFLALFVLNGRLRPRAGRAEIAERYELCEDMAQMLVQPAANKHWDLGVDEGEVLRRIQQGLLADGAVPISTDEAQWVCCRLAELLGWTMPPDPTPPSAETDGADRASFKGQP